MHQTITKISAYPDEREYLIGFMYTRILRVMLGATKLTMDDLDRNTVEQLTCFVISSLIKNNLYSYGPYLELFFKCLLFTDNKYKDQQQIIYKHIDHKQQKREERKLQKITALIPPIVQREFIKIRMNKKVLKLDKISDGMKSLFYSLDTCILSMFRIYSYMPNIQQLHLYESYDINNEFINHFIEFITVYEPSKINLNAIKVFKYSFEGSSQQFQFKQSISKSNEMKIDTLGWKINEYHDQKYYKFMLMKNKPKTNK